MSIPAIDYEVFKQNEECDKEHGAFISQVHRFGCFLIWNCIDEHLVTRVHSSLERLFACSSEVKLVNIVDKRTTPLGHGSFGDFKSQQNDIFCYTDKCRAAQIQGTARGEAFCPDSFTPVNKFSGSTAVLPARGRAASFYTII